MPRYIPGAACWGLMAPKPPVHRCSSARCTSRRWRLLACPYWAEKGRPAFLGECTAAGGSTTARFRVVSKCALRRGLAKRTERPGHSQTLPLSVPSCWSITAFPACVILPQMNHQPMCIWMVKPPFTQYISEQCSGKPGKTDGETEEPFE